MLNKYLTKIIYLANLDKLIVFLLRTTYDRVLID